MPRASPDTVTKPASPSSRAIWLANFAPAADALREPTIAVIGCSRTSALPRTASSGGASSIIRRRAGYSGSPSAMKRAPIRRAVFEFLFGFLNRTDASGSLCAAAPRQRGQGLDRSTCATVVIDQGAKGARSDILASDETQPIEPLAVGEFHTVSRLGACHGFTADCPILDSVPAIRRAMLARCMMKTSRASTKNSLACGRLAERPQNCGRRRAGEQARQRRIAGDGRDHGPDRCVDQDRDPGKSEQHTDEGRHALAALEAEPDRKQVAEESAEARDQSGLGSEHMARDQDRRGALQHVAKQGRGGQPLASGAQHIGRTDIAGADGADVRTAEQLGQQQAERDRSEQIAERQARRSAPAKLTTGLPPRCSTNRHVSASPPRALSRQAEAYS